MKMAVLIPCRNEERTVGKVIQDFRHALPEATIFVYDNASTDHTATIARAHGAVVRHVAQVGKGAVVRTMFRETDADIGILVDGDDTYLAEDVHRLLAPVLAREADMVVGDRHGSGCYRRAGPRRFHVLGNRLVAWLINRLYGCRLADITSGYRVFSRRFIKNCPVLVDGFEVETVLTLHALDKKFRIVEIPVGYRDRPPGSTSKLSTFADGFRVLRAILWVAKDCRPLLFFSCLSAVLFLAALGVGTPVLLEFMRTRYIYKVPSAILASGLAIISFLLLACGLILDTIAKIHRENIEVQLLQQHEGNRSQEKVHDPTRDRIQG